MAPIALEFLLIAEAAPPAGVSEDRLQNLCAFALAVEGATGPWSITVALVGDDRLQALHRDFMGIDTPTDIMTFPYRSAGPDGEGGDLVISVDHAHTQAQAWGLTPAEEVQFLTMHGLLHLLGWRDEDEAKRERMLARQRELIERWQATMR